MPEASTRYLKLPPELVDGVSSEICTVDDAELPYRLATWLEEATEGETLEIGFIEMSARDFCKLPMIGG